MKLVESRARDGSLVLQWDGRWLASSFKPVEEALKWVAQNHARWEVNSGLKSLIIIGAGCGYHAVEASRSFEALDVIVIDNRQELIDWNRQKWSSENVQWLYCQDIEDLQDLEELQDVLKRRYYVQNYPQSWFASPGEMRELCHFLNGRTVEGLQYLANLRESRVVVGKTPRGVLLSIKDVEEIELEFAQKGERRLRNEKLKLRECLLRELVV